MRGRPVAGVVTHLLESSDVKRLSDVTKLLDIPTLSPDDVFFYELLARRTYQSLGSVLYASIPLPPKRKVHKSRPSLEPTSFGVTQDEAQVLRESLGVITSRKHVRMSIPNDRVGLGVVLGLLKTTQDPLLVLVPDVNMVATVYQVAATVTDSIRFILAKQSKTEAYDAWTGLRDGSTRVTIGTRKAVLTPPSPNTRIVMLGCGEDDFTQWDQNPHYDARWCLQVRRATHDNPTVQLDVFPRVEDGEIDADAWQAPDVKIVNMKSGARLSGHYLLSQESLELIGSVDTTSRPLIIFYNRLQRADDATYMGVESLAQLLRNRFPGQFVHVVDAKSDLPSNGIVIVTRTLLYQWNYLQPSMAGLIVLRPEHNLIYRGFRSLEQAARELRRLVSWAVTAHAPCIVQAKEPEIVRKMLGDTQGLRAEELAMRKTLSYPPHGELHVARAKDAGAAELIGSYRVQHGLTGSDKELVVKKQGNEVVEEWLTWPPNCDMFVSPDNIDV